jgi:hypothetical protein
MIRSIAPALILLLATSVATAEPQPGDIGAFADAEGTMTWRSLEALQVEEFYIVAFDPPGGLLGYEYGFSGVREAGGVVVGTRVIESSSPVCEFYDEEFICFTGSCIDDPGPLVLLVATIVFFEAVPPDVAICPRGTTSSSFASSMDQCLSG